jgi:hypothetical protein
MKEAMTRDGSSIHSCTTRLSAWLLAIALLLAPGLTDVCTAWCGEIAPSSAIAATTADAAVTPTHGSQPMDHDHCAKPTASSSASRHSTAAAAISHPRPVGAAHMPALRPATHHCRLHAGTGAPVADDVDVATLPASGSRSTPGAALRGPAAPPAVIPIIFPLASLARSGAMSTPAAPFARPAPLPLQRPLRL